MNWPNPDPPKANMVIGNRRWAALFSALAEVLDGRAKPEDLEQRLQSHCRRRNVDWPAQLWPVSTALVATLKAAILAALEGAHDPR